MTMLSLGGFEFGVLNVISSYGNMWCAPALAIFSLEPCHNMQPPHGAHKPWKPCNMPVPPPACDPDEP